jgi:hypothetical protein
MKRSARIAKKYGVPGFRVRQQGDLATVRFVEAHRPTPEQVIELRRLDIWSATAITDYVLYPDGTVRIQPGGTSDAAKLLRNMPWPGEKSYRCSDWDPRLEKKDVGMTWARLQGMAQLAANAALSANPGSHLPDRAHVLRVTYFLLVRNTGWDSQRTPYLCVDLVPLWFRHEAEIARDFLARQGVTAEIVTRAEALRRCDPVMVNYGPKQSLDEFIGGRGA